MRSRFNGYQLNTTSSAADSTTNISFAWFGSNQNNTGTWDYAPLCEMQEIEPERFIQWRSRMDNDPNYHNQQLQMNQTHDIWHQQWTTAGTNTNFTFDVNGTTMTNDLAFHPRWNKKHVHYNFRS